MQISLGRISSNLLDEYLKEILTIWILGSLERGVESVAAFLPITAFIYRDLPILICALDSKRETHSLDICAFEREQRRNPPSSLRRKNSEAISVSVTLWRAWQGIHLGSLTLSGEFVLQIKC